MPLCHAYVFYLLCCMISLAVGWDVAVPHTSTASGNKAHPSIRYSHASVTYKSSMVTTHGYYFDHDSRDPVWLSDTWLLDLKPKGKWKLLSSGLSTQAAVDAQRAGRVPRVPYGRYGHSLAIHKDSLWLFGGDDGGFSKTGASNYQPGNAFADLWEFDLVKNSWKQHASSASAPTARYLHTAVTVGDSMYLYGGKEQKLLFDEVYKFDFGRQNWSRVWKEGDTAMSPGKRYGQGMEVLDTGRLRGFCIFGGLRFYDETPVLQNDVWFFDIQQLQWRQLQPAGDVPTSRMYVGLAAVSSGSVTSGYVVSGGTTSSPGITCSADAYSFTVNCDGTVVTWSRLPDMIPGCYQHTLAYWQGHVYTFGGHLCTTTKGKLPFWYLNHVHRLDVRTTQRAIDSSKCSTHSEL